MSRTIYILLSLLGLALIGGCSPYIDDYEFEPRPAMAQLPPTTQPGGSPFTATVSIIGVRYADNHAGLPETIEVRMQLDNTFFGPIVVDPRAMRLTNPDLLVFGEGIVDPPTPVNLGPSESAMLDVLFPFPLGHTYENTDLDSLLLRLSVQIGGQTVGQAINFRQVRYYYPNYYDPYWGPGPVFYGGVVIVHRR